MRVMQNAGRSDFDDLPTEVEDDEVVVTTVATRRYQGAATSFHEEETDPLTTVAKRSTLKVPPPTPPSPPPARRPAPPSVLTPLVPLDASAPPAWRAPLGAAAPAEPSPTPAWHAAHVITAPVEPIDASALRLARPRRPLRLVALALLLAALLGAGLGRFAPPAQWRYERAQAELSRACGWLTTTYKRAKASLMASASETDPARKADGAARDGARAVAATEAVDEAR